MIVQPLPEQQRRDVDPDAYVAELLAVLATHIDNHPRSQQVAIGPSEIGVPCDRRIAYKLLGHPERPQPPAWLPTIGTAVHAWNEGAFDADNLRIMAAALHGEDQERWLVETRVTVGYVPGLGFITGSCDLYDRVTGVVTDWKIVGPTTIKRAKAHGPSPTYRSQAHLYGKGWVNAGHWVSRVQIVFLPRNAPLDQAYAWSEAYDPAIADAALARLTRIQAAVAAVGDRILPALPIAEAYCSHCPWLVRGSADPTQGCPGHPDSGISTPAPALSLAG